MERRAQGSRNGPGVQSAIAVPGGAGHAIRPVTVKLLPLTYNGPPMTSSHAPYQWIASQEQLDELVSRVDPAGPLYLDTEFMRERTFRADLALVQVHTGEEIALIDPLRLSAGSDLQSLLHGRRLYMHGCSEDLEVMRHTVGELPGAIGDTQIAAALAGGSLQTGYQRLVEEILGVQLAKEATRTDWLKRPLSPEQLGYAVQDVEYLPPLVEILIERLEQLGRLAWWREECERMLADAARDPEPADLWRQVKGVGRLPPAALAAARSLAAWRDEQARKRNLPRGFVLRDADLLVLSQEQPDSTNRLKALGLHPALVRRDGDNLLGLIRESRHQEAPAPLPGPPDAEERKLVKRLRARVAEIAGELGLEPEVLMRRRWLESLVRHPERLPAALSGWRQELVARPLLEMLP